jgi:hypothetical protein
MSTLVTRKTLWFYAAEIPYVDFECKEVQFFFNFSTSLTFCIPDGTKQAVWPGGKRAAKQDGVDIDVPDWSWWLIADDTVELSCSHHGILGNFLAYYDYTSGAQITVPVTVGEARRIRSAVQEMMNEAEAGAERFPIDKTRKILRPSFKAIAYPIKAYRWTNPDQRLPAATQFGPHWNPPKN